MASTIIGLDFYGKEVFESPTPSLKNFHYLEMKDLIADEIHIRERTDFDISPTQVIVDDLSQGEISEKGD